MASVTVRNLPDAVHRAIRVRAGQQGRSREAELYASAAPMPALSRRRG